MNETIAPGAPTFRSAKVKSMRCEPQGSRSQRNIRSMKRRFGGALFLERRPLGRQSRTHANLKVRAPKPATRTDANLKAHLLGTRSCRAPNGLGVMNETIAPGAPTFRSAKVKSMRCEPQGSRSQRNIRSMKRRFGGALFLERRPLGRQSRTHANLKVRAPKPATIIFTTISNMNVFLITF